MKKIISLLCAVLLLTGIVPAFTLSTAAADTADELVLAQNGTAEHVIVISVNASAAEKNAARVLTDYLKRICGAEFETVTDDTAPQPKEIVLGVTNRDAEINMDRSAYGDDGVRILTNDDKLFITGGKKNGAIYGVYTFLEEQLGCRWFTGELTIVPETDRLAIEPIDYTYVPCFRLRQTYWSFSAANPEFCSAHKLNGVMAYVPDEMGGCAEEYAVNSVHTLQWIITRDLFDEHPEYFGCDENGVRNPDRQPCLSNEDVLRITVDFALDFFSQYNTILSISQNDGRQFCQCEKCAAFNKAHGNTDAASMVNFVNKVAAAVRETYPEARFETLAYQDTIEPPTGLTIADDVVIRMCPINGCVLHDFGDPLCRENAAFDKALKGWAALTGNIYMWNYSTNFQYYYALFPNVTTLQARYQYFRDNNVISVFDNGCGENMVPAEFHDLKTYLVLKLLWDPDTDIERHISEFCDAYYGEAGQDVVKFIDRFEKAVKGYNPLTFSFCHMGCQDGGESLENHSGLKEAEILALDKLMDAAQNRTLTEEEAYRLRGLTISWRFYKCATFAGEFNWFSCFNDPATEAEKLYNDMRDYGIEFLSEGGNVRLDSGTPDFTTRPTWWFRTKEEMPVSVRILSKILPVINRILRSFNIFNIKEPVC